MDKMKIKFGTRCMAMLLTLMTVIGALTIFASNPVTVEAGYVPTGKLETGWWSYPTNIEGHENDAGWGHTRDLNLMGKWFHGKGNHFTIHWMNTDDSATNDMIVYCIEPGVNLNRTSKYNSYKGVKYFEDNAGTWNETINGETIGKLLAHVLTYGYQGKYSKSWPVTGNSPNLAKVMATQYLVWEVVVGERDAQFNHVDTGAYDKVLDMLQTSNPLYSQIMTQYRNIEKEVQDSFKLPSFMSDTLAGATIVQPGLFDEGLSSEQIRLTDTNGVLDRFIIASNNAKVKVDPDPNYANSIIITFTGNTQSSVDVSAIITATPKPEYECNPVTPVIWENPSKQNFVGADYGETFKDPLKGYLKTSYTYRYVRIQKEVVDANGNVIPNAAALGLLEGWEFSIYQTHAAASLLPELVINGGNVYSLIDTTITSISDNLIEPLKIAPTNSTPYAIGVSGADGTIQVRVAPGRYDVYETGYPPNTSTGFWGPLPDSPQSIDVTDPNGSNTVKFRNTYNKGDLKIIKQVAGLDDPEEGTIMGWQFAIYKNYNASTGALSNLVGTYTTGKDGVITQALDPGTYYIKETGAPSGIDTKYWKQDTHVATVTVSRGNTAFAYFTNTVGGLIEVTKNTTNSGTRAGWVFTVYNDSRCRTQDIVTTITTSTSGKGTTADVLPQGTYYVKETSFPSSMSAAAQEYWIRDTHTATVNVVAETTVTASTNGNLVYENKFGGKIEIDKTVKNNVGTKQGWQFKIYTTQTGSTVAKYIDGTTIPTLTSDANGKIITTGLLDNGTYWIQEIGYPSSQPLGNYYWNDLPTARVPVTVTAGGTYTATFENTWYGRINIKKILENQEAATVSGVETKAGWVFTVYTNSACTTVATDCYGNRMQNLVTDQNGNITTERLLPGDYWVKEVGYQGDVPFEYWFVSGENPQKITVTAGLTGEVSFDNALRPGQITIHKTDSEGKALKDVSFLLEWSDDGVNWSPVTFTDSKFVKRGTSTSAGLKGLTGENRGVLTTDADGIVTYEGLYPLHYYRLSEVSTQSGYQLLTEPIFVGKLSLDKDLEESFTVVNHKLMSLPKTGNKEIVMLSTMIVALAMTGTLLVIEGKRKHSTK